MAPKTKEVTISKFSTKVGLLNARSVLNKSATIHEKVIDNGLELLAITETWLRNGDENAVNELCGHGFKFVCENRPNAKGKRGGGIGFVVKSNINLKTRSHDFNTFEAMTINIMGKCSASITLIYRPPPSKKNGLTVHEFQNEIETLMSELCASTADNLLIIGDLNMHYGKRSNHIHLDFDKMIQGLGMKQLVKDPTHKSGNILDVIIARDENKINSIHVHDQDISDHSLITFDIMMKPTTENHAPIKIRSLRSVNMTAFVEDVRMSMLSDSANANDMNGLIECYNRIMESWRDS